MLFPSAVRLSATSGLRPSRLRFGRAVPPSSIVRMPSPPSTASSVMYCRN